ncbi:hypothetical protein A3A76_06015 [Candidatus Woesebacteria bacterium RIFCSPLOWO2_01_FULL_39_23]|nr:MAG: hypothetical protein A3E41_04360 [Candidatus Woesebacteria bacterium RIFCSPHIGHO2_12_FULL_38_9]OGM63232.1 MAG: hypothetical protein A3A76_06015 [Candidatus Woesebacteria bacterium RIFCSPLOWO2_01_FULL_39_23]
MQTPQLASNCPANSSSSGILFDLSTTTILYYENAKEPLFFLKMYVLLHIFTAVRTCFHFKFFNSIFVARNMSLVLKVFQHRFYPATGYGTLLPIRTGISAASIFRVWIITIFRCVWHVTLTSLNLL